MAGIFIFLTSSPQANANVQEKAVDEENCFMCHRHRFNGRIDEDGRRRIYHVDETIYSQSVHRAISCRDCHTYIKKIPHDPVTEEVNCSNQCHIKPPFTQEEFSHKKIVGVYNESAHGINTEDSDKLKSALPYCKFCHLNPLYTRVSEKTMPYEKTLRRCFNCHLERGVTLAYRHITHRLRKRTSRSSPEIVQLCSKCHQDVELMKRLNVSERALEAVETYNGSIHGKLVRLGSEKAANCVSCHASSALHDIYKKDHQKATIRKASIVYSGLSRKRQKEPSFRKDNLTKTCNQCHDKVNSWFINVAVHPRTNHDENLIIQLVKISLGFGMYSTVFALVGLMLFESFGRRRDGIKLIMKNGTTWRRKPKRRSKKEK